MDCWSLRFRASAVGFGVAGANARDLSFPDRGRVDGPGAMEVLAVARVRGLWTRARGCGRMRR